MTWKHEVRIKHLFTEQENHKSIQDSMSAVADVLETKACFDYFDCSKFRSIPQGDDVFGPRDYAKVLFDQMYDYADAQRIWLC